MALKNDIRQPSYVAFLNDNKSEGYLQIFSTTGNSALPVQNAYVTVSKKIGENEFIVSDIYTDENGKTPIINLATKSKSLSENSEFIKPYATYDVLVQHPDFTAIQFLDVPIFEGIISNQPVNFIPKIDPSELILINEKSFENLT